MKYSQNMTNLDVWMWWIPLQKGPGKSFMEPSFTRSCIFWIMVSFISGYQMNILCVLLRALNRQKLKSKFLTCPCHKIYREKAVDLKVPIILLKIMIFVNMVKFWAILWKIWYFVINCLNQSSNLKILLHICDTYNCGLFAAHHISFVLYQFSVKYRFPFPNFAFFTVKPPSVTQRSVSQENAF